MLKITQQSLFNVLMSLLYQRVNPLDLKEKLDPLELVEDSAIVIFNTCIELAQEGKEYFFKPVRIALDNKGILDIHEPYIQRVHEYNLPDYYDTDNIEDDIYKIKLAYKKKSLEDFFLLASMKMNQEPESVEEVLKELSDFSFDNTKKKTSDVVELSDQMFPLLTDMLNGKSEFSGNPLFGIIELDDMIRGFIPGDVILIAGRPKMGKSTTENTIMANLIRSGIKFASFSGEQRNQTRWINLLAALSNQSYVNIENGKDYDFNKVSKGYELLSDKSKTGFFHLYEDQLSLPFLREKVKYHFYREGIKVFLIDRIGLFKEIDARNDHTSRTRITSEIRAMANELGVTFVVFSQANANLDSTLSKRPTPSSVYGNTGVLANCTKGILLYRPEEYGFTEFPEDSKKYRGTSCEGKIEVIAAIGNRIGRGSVRLNFDYERVLLKTETLGYHEKRDTEVPF